MGHFSKNNEGANVHPCNSWRGGGNWGWGWAQMSYHGRGGGGARGVGGMCVGANVRTPKTVISQKSSVDAHGPVQTESLNATSSSGLR